MPNDHELGEQLKLAGMEQTLDAESAEWKADVLATIRSFQRGARFTSDSLSRVVGPPHHGSCWGAIMRSAATHGLSKGTKQYVPSTRPKCHAAIIQVWERL